MNAFEYLKSFEFLPQRGANLINRRPSNSEIRRWLQNKSIIINGEKPPPEDEIEFPVTSLIFFPASRPITTILEEDWEIAKHYYGEKEKSESRRRA